MQFKVQVVYIYVSIKFVVLNFKNIKGCHFSSKLYIQAITKCPSGITLITNNKRKGRQRYAYSFTKGVVGNEGWKRYYHSIWNNAIAKQKPNQKADMLGGWITDGQFCVFVKLEQNTSEKALKQFEYLFEKYCSKDKNLLKFVSVEIAIPNRNQNIYLIVRTF